MLARMVTGVSAGSDSRAVRRGNGKALVVTDGGEVTGGAGGGHRQPVGGARTHRPRALLRALVICVGLSLLSLTWPAGGAHAQALASPQTDGQLILDADELIYDNDRQVVTASGSVQLVYGDYRVVAQRVSYDQRTRRVMASGDVEVLEPNGNRIYADEIDITDDFGDGFVNALRVERPDDTRFAAESAERFAGEKTVFNHGVYTACRECKERPSKPLSWRIKAERVILNGKTKTIAYENATFEFFGRPIAFLPYFRHSSEDTKRQSGFLLPNAGYASELGAWVTQPYFWATSETTDLTISPTAYSNQGLLTHLRWRQQFENGYYALYGAYIRQQNPDDFASPQDQEEDRWMAATRGRYDFNSRWHAGWSWHWQSDRNFSYTYGLPVFSGTSIVNEVYLRGLHDLSYFDLAAMQFRSQATEQIVDDKQGAALPILDYNAVRLSPAFGELSLDVNAQMIERDAVSTFGTRVTGLEGRSSRLSGDLAWKKSWTTAGGLTLTPSVSLRGDVTDVDTNGAAGVDQGTITRAMPTVGLEARYPLLARAGSSSHVFEPVAQIFARPDLVESGTLPNEDSQSLVFDPTTLFQRDKFSGYDRIEEGTRANVGLRYSGVFLGGWTVSALVGQSYHLAGTNPYARTDDPVRTGVASGLEDDVSDYVAALGLTGPSALSFQGLGRFDKDDATFHRGEAQLSYSGAKIKLAGAYTFTDSRATVADMGDLHQVSGSATWQFAKHWSASGAVAWDIANAARLSNSIGLSYHDECFTFSLAFSQTRNDASSDFSNVIGVKFSLRTVGNVAYDAALDSLPTAGNQPEF